MRKGRLEALYLVLALAAGCGDNLSVGSDGGAGDAAVGVDAPSPAAMLSIDRASADLGMVVVGQTSAPTTFTVTNTGDLASGALSTTLAGAAFAITANTCTGQALAAGATCQVSVTATPPEAGVASGALLVSGTPGGSVNATLTVTGLAPGALMAMPPSVDFGVVTSGTMTPPMTITIRNTGGAATGAVAVALAGADAASFELVTNGCAGMVLAPAASCEVSARMRPAVDATGAKSATVTATAMPGGATMTTLTGTAQRPGTITLAGDDGSFGNVLIGMNAVRTVIVTNSGQQATGTLTIARNGAPAFAVLAGVAGDCESGTTTLAPAATCNLRLRFTPTAAGLVNGSVMVSATPGGSQMLALTGTGLRPPTLVGSIPVGLFGVVEVNTLSTTTVIWSVRNGGDLITSVPVVTTSAEVEASNNTCTAALAPAAMCSMTLRFRPSTGGPRNGSAMVSVAGSSVMVSAVATGGFRVTLTREGASGTITSNPAGLTCAPPAASCEGVFAPGTVALSAATANGLGFRFAGGSGPSVGACAGLPNRACNLTVDGAEAITGAFAAITSNLTFVTSQTYPTNLGGAGGGAAAYDMACNSLATAAGINNVAGDNFVAWMSDSTNSPTVRLGAASGWVRMDGRVFAANRNAMLGNAILNPVRFTENGADAGDAKVLTGTNPDGSSVTNCSNWTTDANGARSRDRIRGPKSLVCNDYFGLPRKSAPALPPTRTREACERVVRARRLPGPTPHTSWLGPAFTRRRAFFAVVPETRTIR